MSRHAALLRAARWTMQDDEQAPAEPPPALAGAVQATLGDPALSAALNEISAVGRLSDMDIRVLRGERHRVFAGSVALILLALTGVGGWAGKWSMSMAPRVQHFETSGSEQRKVRLEDGSVLKLDRATSVDVAINAQQRVVALRHGKAFFDVAHEPDRAFLVTAGGSATRVLGTAFTVDISAHNVKLTVYRGRVRFGDEANKQQAVFVPAGWSSRFTNGSASKPFHFAAAQQARRSAWIDTDNIRLGELVRVLNRRGDWAILPISDRLAAIPLAGRFQLENPEQLLGVLGDAYGFKLARKGRQLRLISNGGGVS
jgi:transmembrane sensor